MPSFSYFSKSNLLTVDNHLQVLFNEVIKEYDCMVLYGHRTPEEQFELFKKGREQVNGVWLIADPALVVTYCDGYKKKSKHNYQPALAVDVIPFVNGKACDYSNQVYHFCGYVTAYIRMMHLTKIRGGHDWNSDLNIRDQSFNDLLHWEV